MATTHAPPIQTSICRTGVSRRGSNGDVATATQTLLDVIRDNTPPQSPPTPRPQPCLHGTGVYSARLGAVVDFTFGGACRRVEVAEGLLICPDLQVFAVCRALLVSCAYAWCTCTQRGHQELGCKAVPMHIWVHACVYACVRVCVCACMHGSMYACMHACMHVCIHVRMHTCMHDYTSCMHVCIHAFMHTCMHVYTSCMHVCMYACIHVRMCTHHACMYACMHVCMYACMHACMHACIHTCTHAHT